MHPTRDTEYGDPNCKKGIQESHHEMRIPERDVTSYLFIYLRLSINIH